MADTTSNSRINIYINNEAAKRALVELEDAFRKNAEAIAKVTAAGGDNAEELKKLRAEEDRLKEAMAVKRREAGLNALSYSQLRAEYTALLKLYNTAIPGTPYRKRLENELKAIRQRMNEVEVNSKRCTSTLAAMANRFNQFAGMITTAAVAVTGISLKFRQLAQDVAKMDDTYADVMKTTGMTRDEVVDLNEELKKMDTRTSREELNLLARDAGKLGITGKKDILDFVEAGNQIRVALGEDLGEDAIKNIGKIVDLFKKSQGDLQQLDLKGQMLAVGSAINQLGQSSTASEPYMVAFAGRMGGVAAQAKISIQNVLGFASALDQNMQAVEMSSTALSKFIMQLYEDPAKFAKLAGQDVKAFTALLGSDANAAIKQVLTALNEKGGFQQLVPMFQAMNLDGARAVSVLSALATNIDKVNEAQVIANAAFAEGTSITNEYSIKNNNLQAQLEKARNQFKEAALGLGEHLSPALLKSTNLTTYLIKALPILIDFFKTYGGILVVAAATVAAYTAAVKLQTWWIDAGRLAGIKKSITTKALAIAETAATLVTNLYAAAQMRLAGNTAGANQAMRVFWNTLKLNPLGFIIGLITALAGGIYLIARRSAEAARASREFYKELTIEQDRANRLFEQLKNNRKGSEEYEAARKKIIEQYGDYLKGLINEKGELINVEVAQRRVNKELERSIAIKQYNSAREDVIGKSIESERKGTEALLERLQWHGKTLEQAQQLVSKVKAVFEQDKGRYEEWLEAIELLKKNGIGRDDILGMSLSLFRNNINKTKDDLKQLDGVFGAIIPKEKELSPLDKLRARLNELTKKIKSDDNQFFKIFKLTPEQRKAIEDEIAQLEARRDALLKKKPDGSGGGGKKPTSTYANDLKAMEEEQAQFMLLLKQAHAEEKGNEEKHQEQLQVMELQFLKEKRDLQRKHGEDTTKTETEIADKIIALDKTTYTRRSKEQDDALSQWLADEKNALDAELINEEQYQVNVIKKELQHLEEKLKLAEEYGQGTLSLAQQIAAKKIAIAKHGYEQEVRAQKEAQQQLVSELQAQFERGEISAEFYQHRLLAIEIEGLKERLAIAKAAGKNTAPIEAEISKKSAQATKELNAIRKKLFKGELEERRDMELKFLKDSHKAGILSDKKYAQESLKVWSKYAADKAKQVGDYAMGVIQPVGNAIKAFEDAEIAERDVQREQELGKLTEEYNEKIRLAEENGEDTTTIRQEFEDQKAQIEYNAAKDNLDTQKKYADSNFAIQATQAVITGIISAMSAFSAMAAIPVVGPVLGGIAAAAVAVTVAAQIKSLNAERQRIKSITLEAPSSSSSSSTQAVPNIPPPPSRVVNEEDLSGSEVVSARAKGKYDVISEDDGREYRDVPMVQSATGVVQRPTLVAEEPELVVSVKDFPYLQKHVNYPLVLEAINDARSGRTVPARAQGDYSRVSEDSRQYAVGNKQHGGAALMESLRQLGLTMEEVRELLAYLKQNGVEATTVYVATEAEKQQKRLEQSRKNAS